METMNRVEMHNIEKHFGGVKALKNASLELRPGEIHALVGENGAGKSTLMKILSGALARDGGEVKFEGKNIELKRPKDAIDMGISTIYQEFMLAPQLTVAENIFIDRFMTGSKFVNWSEMNENAAKLLNEIGFSDIDPKSKVQELSVAYQQVVEICKSLSRQVKVLILDEPTAVLTFREIEKLFSLLRSLRDNGVSIIYISHRLDEIFELCDRITVMKDGEYIKTLTTAETNKNALTALMVGRDLSNIFPPRNAEIGETILEVNNLSVTGLVEDVSFSVKKGEVLGFYGLVGAGRTEALEAVFGARKKSAGEVIFQGRKVNFTSPKAAVKAGLGMLPEDRKKHGLILSQKIRINTTLSSMQKVMNKAGIFNTAKERQFTIDTLKSIATKYGSIEDNASSLSGGNQQKIVLGKWLAADSQCIIFDEPTRGVDVGAKSEIYECINQLAEKGIGIVMISSEMPELMGMCDRMIVMRQGHIMATLNKEELDEKVIINSAMGVNE